MKSWLACGLSVLAACSCPPGDVAPALREALDARTDRPHGAAPSMRVEFDGTRVRAWSREIRYGDLPPRVARAADAILPDGATWWVGRGERDGTVEFSVEKRYATTDPGEGVRRVRLAADGTVIERSYPITTEQLPEPVARTVAALENIPLVSGLSLPQTYEVVQGAGPDRYRVRGPVQDMLREYDADGNELRRGRVQNVQATTW